MAKGKAQKRLEAAQRQQAYEAKCAADAGAPINAIDQEIRENMIAIRQARGDLRTPRLIQRAAINRPISKFAGKVLSEAVETDYMGNSDFEFGKMARSLRVLQAFSGQLGLYDHPTIRHANGARLTVMRFLNDEQAEKYDGYLSRLRGEGPWLQTAEFTRFDKSSDGGQFNNTDLWWDLENHVFWSFDHDFMSNLRFCLEASWAHMDHERRKDLAEQRMAAADAASIV
jgi:hypothetical protein